MKAKQYRNWYHSDKRRSLLLESEIKSELRWHKSHDPSEGWENVKQDVAVAIEYLFYAPLLEVRNLVPIPIRESVHWILEGYLKNVNEDGLFFLSLGKDEIEKYREYWENQ